MTIGERDSIIPSLPLLLKVSFAFISVSHGAQEKEFLYLWDSGGVVAVFSNIILKIPSWILREHRRVLVTSQLFIHVP